MNSSPFNTFFDVDTNVMYLTARGDRLIRYYEIFEKSPYCMMLDQFRASPVTGISMIPKRLCNVEQCEIGRFMNLCEETKSIQPISLIVPRIVRKIIFPNPLE